jgi:hypothetical protein
MAFNPIGQQYKPDPLASGGADQKPFQEANVPKTGSIVNTLLRLAMRRLPSAGFGAKTMAPTIGVKPPSNAMTMGSHGKIS